MARSWTRLHEYLGAPPGPLNFDMIARAAADRLAEFDDLDWKEQLPQPPRDGRWNELAKDVAAMANTRGGLIIYGVRDKTCDLVGIDPDEANPDQYAQWVRNHVHPYLADLTFTTFDSPDGATSVLVADVPASPMAPHLVYGTAAKDKDQQAAVAPYRDRDHTAWMAEHQLERAYRDRFTRAQHAEDEAQRLLKHAQETAFVHERKPSAWFFAVARPERPLPRTAPRPASDDAFAAVRTAQTRSQQLTGNPTVTGVLSGLLSTPRPGLRCWVMQTLTLGVGRQLYAELHHDGSMVLAADLSGKLADDGFLQPPENSLLVDQDYTAGCCCDAVTITQELARCLGVDSALRLTASVAAATPTALVPVTTFSGFKEIPDRARYPHRVQTVSALLRPIDTEDVLRSTAQEVFTDLMNQFGLDPQL
ncbi:ATP-binding protein [Streptomyces sp. NPDC047117]|uniref:AlbA family DNA-binding domain-containing protein n=1 Tax=Streptomyces sp. NPDC047117 TaxID=3155379 RepID=UPI0033E0D232